MSKQIYAAIELNDSEVRLIVGEFFDTRFNVMKVVKTPLTGIVNFQIINRSSVLKALKEAVYKASSALGTSVERVILLIPSVNYKRHNLKISVTTSTGMVTYEDVKRAMDLAIKTPNIENKALINVVANRYTVNGISYRKIPLKEVASELVVDIDLLMCDRQLAFDYVSLVEESGLKILDVTLDMYAMSKEAALFEKSLDQNIIIIKAENQTTSFGLINKGKLAHCEVIEEGFDNLVTPLVKKYEIPLNNLSRLVKYHMKADRFLVRDDIIGMWMKNDVKQAITDKMLFEGVNENLTNYVNHIHETCRPILESGYSVIVLTGEGSKMKALADKLASVTNVNTKAYIPETFGVRDGALSCLLGAFYGFNDNLPITGNKLASVDLLEFENLMNKQIRDPDSESLTSKLKSLLNYSKKEN